MSLRLAGPRGSAFLLKRYGKSPTVFTSVEERPKSKSLAERKCKPCEGGVQPLSPEAAKELLSALHAGWTYDEPAAKISRLFEFPSFARTIAFTNAVAWIATVEGHHPEMTVNYGSCTVMYRTTAIDGLSDNDFICAAKVDLLTVTA